MTDEVYKLVPLADLKGHLDIDVTDLSHDTVLTGIRDGVEALLESQTNQEFSPAQYGLIEIHDGTGTDTLWARRPISDIGDITLTYGPLDAITTLSITAVSKFRVGHRRIRCIMYSFPEGVNNVQLTYDTVANIPAIGVLAVKEASAAIFRRIGSEDARSEGVGTFSHVLLRDLDESIFWKKAVTALSIFPIG